MEGEEDGDVVFIVIETELGTERMRGLRFDENAARGLLTRVVGQSNSRRITYPDDGNEVIVEVANGSDSDDYYFSAWNITYTIRKYYCSEKGDAGESGNAPFTPIPVAKAKP